MQHFSATLAGSHSPHDQSNSLSLAILFLLNCIRHAPRAVAHQELQVVRVQLSATPHRAKPQRLFTTVGTFERLSFPFWLPFFSQHGRDVAMRFP